MRTQLLAFFKERVGNRLKDVEADCDLFQSQILDSFETLQLVFFIEEKFGVTIDLESIAEDDLRTLTSISDLIARSGGPGAR